MYKEPKKETAITRLPIIKFKKSSVLTFVKIVLLVKCHVLYFLQKYLFKKNICHSRFNFRLFRKNNKLLSFLQCLFLIFLFSKFKYGNTFKNPLYMLALFKLYYIIAICLQTSLTCYPEYYKVRMCNLFIF